MVWISDCHSALANLPHAIYATVVAHTPTAAQQAAERADYVTPELMDAKLTTLCSDFGCDLNAAKWQHIGSVITSAGLIVTILLPLR